MPRRHKVAECKTVPPSPCMTPTQQLAYARKKRQERYAEEHPEFLTSMRYHGTGFTSTFVNGRDVTQGSVWAPRPEGLQSGHRRRAQPQFEHIKKSLGHSKKNLNKIVDRAQRKLDKVAHRKKSTSQLHQPTKQQHNPRVVRLLDHQPSSLGLRHRASIFMSKSMSLSNLTRSVTKHFHRTLERVATPIDEPVIDSFYYDMNEEEKQIITRWLTDAGEDQPPDVFNALTTAELLRMKGATIDTIEHINAYHGPPPSPLLKASEPEYILDWIGELEEEKEPRPKCKDLIRYLGTNYSRFHLVKESASDSTYLDPTNLSDYYQMPFIYPDVQAQAEHEDVIDSASGYDSDGSSIYDSTENHFRSPRSHPPAQSLILHLRSRGLNIDQIAHKISVLQHHFLFSHSSRTINGYRVPEYWDMDDTVLEKLEQVVRMPMEEWEYKGARDRFGKVYPEGYKILKCRMRERGARRLVCKTLENHLWYRCKRGERPHTDITL